MLSNAKYINLLLVAFFIMMLLLVFVINRLHHNLLYNQQALEIKTEQMLQEAEQE
jgi:hypothetical protein